MGDTVRHDAIGTLRRMRFRLRRGVAAAGVLAAALFATAGPVSARAALDYTLPTDGAAIGEPLTEVIVAFTEPVRLVGPGFVVRSPQDEVTQPFAVTDDDTVFRLQIDPPMGGGVVVVDYEVMSEDGRVVDGSFSFTVAVDAPAPTTSSIVGATTVDVPAATNASVAGTPVTTGSERATDQVADQAGRPSTTDVGPTPSPAAPDVGAGDGGRVPTGTVVVVAAVVAAGAAAFLALRRRPSA